MTDNKLNDQFFNVKCVELNNELMIGVTALHLSVMKNEMNQTKRLLRSGADINLKTGSVSTKTSQKMMKELSLEGHNIIRYSPLHLAVIIGSQPMIQLLIDRKADIEATDHNWLRPIELSVSLKKPKVTALLIKNNAQYKSSYYNHWPLLFRAIDSQDRHLVALFGRLQTRSLYYKNETPIEYAMKVFPECVTILIDFGRQLHFPNDTTGETPLHLAVRYKRDDWVKELCYNTCNPNVANNDGDRPLHLAVKFRCDSQMLLILLGFGADPNFRNYCNHTALSLAIELNNTEAISLLLRYRSNWSPLKSKLSELEHSIRFHYFNITFDILKTINQKINKLFEDEPLIWFFLKHCVNAVDNEIMVNIIKRIIEMTDDINTLHCIWGTPLHYLIYANICKPNTLYLKLFKELMASQKCDINQNFKPKDAIYNGETVEVDRIMASGSPLSFALQMNKCGDFAVYLIKMGANYEDIDWENIYFAPDNTMAFKMLITMNCKFPKNFSTYSDPRHDESVPDDEYDYYIEMFDKFIKWMNKRLSKPLTLKEITRNFIRKQFETEKCRQLMTNSDRLFANQLPKSLINYLKFFNDDIN
ncbi:ankyrin-1-like [Oppia nitens]|uniref:ankyrin-1-like n=1 Tax=Oppia nitens TaxID=1686743 RepID=UPI0023DB9DA8|nr:ankyrin-1-like [Oppia nitens]